MKFLADTLGPDTSVVNNTVKPAAHNKNNSSGADTRPSISALSNIYAHGFVSIMYILHIASSPHEPKKHGSPKNMGTSNNVCFAPQPGKCLIEAHSLFSSNVLGCQVEYHFRATAVFPSRPAVNLLLGQTCAEVPFQSMSHTTALSTHVVCRTPENHFAPAAEYQVYSKIIIQVATYRI